MADQNQDLDASGAPATIGDVLERLDRLTDLSHVTLRDVQESFGRASFVPALMIPSLLVVSPLSGIPFFSTICGLMIFFVTAQMLARREHVWLPELLLSRSVSGPRLHNALQRIRRLGGWIDRNSSERLRFLMLPPMVVLFYLLCLVAGGMMPFLELVPFSSSILGLSVLLMAAGFLTRDGLLALAGAAVFMLAPAIPLAVLASV
ncbi:MAG: exopolysaccharide biosynthesis protein [Paracoccaceae bacterium]